MADNIPFSIGSALDNALGWSLEAETKGSSKEIKEPCKHRLVLKMEKRRGKPVSMVGPFSLSKERMTLVCSNVKRRLGSGGTCKDEWMEFQGECREKLKLFLQDEGFLFKA
ncbi:MAG: translation initiation factor [Sulfurospirillaceae bacterium]|jgi:translation initiation factor 1|nr:translation initiation factor [Sulfurospirillaceae bacterium]